MITGKILGNKYVVNGNAADVSGFVPDMSADIYYEVIRLIDSKALFLPDHLKRLQLSLSESGIDYPGDHRVNPGCTGCHKGSIGSGRNRDNYPNQLQYAPFCAGCHAGYFESEGDHIGGRSGTIEQNKNCGQSGCHRVTSSGF